jgi:hypothetical protein
MYDAGFLQCVILHVLWVCVLSAVYSTVYTERCISARKYSTNVPLRYAAEERYLSFQEECMYCIVHL